SSRIRSGLKLCSLVSPSLPVAAIDTWKPCPCNAGFAAGLAAALLLRLRKPVAAAEEEMPRSQPLSSPPPPATQPVPAEVDEMEALRFEISGLRDRLLVHGLEARQPLR
ncbi:MAG TPA: hypothetical protein VN284_01655, partial [Rhizobium sp.]|nr:hypothetical protein [Rhizobium sp.]